MIRVQRPGPSSASFAKNMFEFEGDYFNATAVVVILKTDDCVKIYVYGDGDPFSYEFEDDEVEKKHGEAVASWKKALGE